MTQESCLDSFSFTTADEKSLDDGVSSLDTFFCFVVRSLLKPASSPFLLDEVDEDVVDSLILVERRMGLAVVEFLEAIVMYFFKCSVTKRFLQLF